MAVKKKSLKVVGKSRVDDALELKDTMNRLFVELRVVEAAHGNLVGSFSIDERVDYDSRR